ncbi:hypothetical protein HDU84_001469 [Entophlyctis sp. JEL0112]|nr:hypothetical protein HDU84_001469 [Entophlyctis sp. JEL0112]
MDTKEQIARLKAAINNRKRAIAQSYSGPNRVLVLNSGSAAPPPIQVTSVVHPSVHRPLSRMSKNRRLVVAKTSNSEPPPNTSNAKTEVAEFVSSGNKLVRVGKSSADTRKCGANSVPFFQLTSLNSGAKSRTSFVSTNPKRPNKIVVNDVEYKVDSFRKKLVRVGAPPPTPASTKKRPRVTEMRPPKRIMIGKTAYAKTKSGNLIPIGQTFCPHYTRGKCRLAHRCPFIHDPHRRAICRRYLFSNSCALGGETCPLSHSASWRNAPLCVFHTTRPGACRDPLCRFVHATAPTSSEGETTAPTRVCRKFARGGFCDVGFPKPQVSVSGGHRDDSVVLCRERHVWVCPDADAGIPCSFGDKCKLPPCRLIRKGLDPVKYQQADSARNVKAPLETAGDILISEQATDLRKPDFVSGFNPRRSSQASNGEDKFRRFEAYGSNYSEESDSESEQSDVEVEDDNKSDNDTDGGSDEYNEGDIVDLDWEGDEAI